MKYLIAILLGMSLTACCPSCFIPKNSAGTANEADESLETVSDEAAAAIEAETAE